MLPWALEDADLAFCHAANLGWDPQSALAPMGDRVQVHESIEFLGHDMSRFRADEIPTYGPLLAHLGERFGWKASEFRGYRTRIAYPVYGWQVSMSFEPPVDPGA